MSDDEPKDESTDASEQQPEEQPTDTDQPSAQSDDARADSDQAVDSDQSAEQSDEQPADSDQPAEQSEEQSADTDQAVDQSEEQPAEADQPAEQSDEQSADSDQPAEQSEDQPAESDRSAEQAEEQPADSDQSAAASADDTVAFAGDAASPGGGGPGVQPRPRPQPKPQPRAPAQPAKRKRLFRFGVYADDSKVPDPIKNVFSPDPTDYFFGYGIAGAGDVPHMLEDGWTRIPVGGRMNFPFSTVDKQFLIIVAVVPNSKVDPNAPASEPLQRIKSVRTDNFAPIKAADEPTLVKKFPDGFFSLIFNLVALYISIPVAGSTTFQAELGKAKIRPEDIAYDASSPLTDASGKVIGTKHDVVYWSTDFHTSGIKYVP
jgi:hypothetical protein